MENNSAFFRLEDLASYYPKGDRSQEAKLVQIKDPKNMKRDAIEAQLRHLWERGGLEMLAWKARKGEITAPLAPENCWWHAEYQESHIQRPRVRTVPTVARRL